MSAAKQLLKWMSFLNDFSEANQNQPVRLATFENISGVTNDYWLVDGLALLGFELGNRENAAVVEIKLDGFTHVARDVRTIRAVLSLDGSEDGLDLVGPRETTILRFEDHLETKTRVP